MWKIEDKFIGEDGISPKEVSSYLKRLGYIESKGSNKNKIFRKGAILLVTFSKSRLNDSTNKLSYIKSPMLPNNVKDLAEIVVEYKENPLYELAYFIYNNQRGSLAILTPSSTADLDELDTFLTKKYEPIEKEFLNTIDNLSRSWFRQIERFREWRLY